MLILSARAWPDGGPLRLTGVLFLLVLIGPGCTESVAPPPSGRVEGGLGPRDFANDVPGVGGSGERRVLADSRGTGPSMTERSSTRPEATQPAVTETNDTPPEESSSRFYEVANAAVAAGPAGRHTLQDDRPAEVRSSAAANYPPLAVFAPAADPLASDAQAAYSVAVNPAGGEPIAYRKPIALETAADTIEGICFSAPADGQVVVASRMSGLPERTRLDRYEIATGKRVSSVELPDRAELIDVAPDGSRALVRLTLGLPPGDRPASSQTRLDVWELIEETGRHIAGWQPGAAGEGSASVPLDAVFVDADHVATVTADAALTLWNLPGAQAVFSVTDAGRGPLVASPGRESLMVFDGVTFASFDARTGAAQGRLNPLRPTLATCREAAFSPDGTQFAAVLRRPAQSLVVWDIASGRPAAEIDAPLELGRGLHFGAQGFAVAGGVLFDLGRKNPVWLYTRNANCRNVGDSPDDRHWIVMQPAFKPPQLEAIAAPTLAIADAIRTVSSLTPPLVAPGETVAVELSISNLVGDRAEFDETFAKALGRVVAGRGWRLDAGAGRNLVVTATGKPTGERINFESDSGDEIVPTHEIEFTVALVDSTGEPLWAESGRVPPSYHLGRQKGKSLEDVLLEELWASAPENIAERIEATLPLYVRSALPTDVLGQTRLWAGADDITLPRGGTTASSNVARTPANGMPAENLPVRQPSTTVNVGNNGVRDVVVSLPPLSLVLTTSDDGSARVFQPSPQTRTLRRVDEMPASIGATRLAAYPTGLQFAVGTDEGEIRIYDAGRRSFVRTLAGADSAVTAVCVTTEPILLGGTQGGRVYRWNESNRAPTELAEGQAQVTDLASVPYQNRAIAVWGDGTAMLIDAGTGKTVETFDPRAGRIESAAVSLDATTVAFSTSSNGVVLMSLETGQEIGRVDEGTASAVAFHPGGAHFATANNRGQITLWDVKTRVALERLGGAGGTVTAIVFSPDGKHAAAAVAGRKTLFVWDLANLVGTGNGTP